MRVRTEKCREEARTAHVLSSIIRPIVLLQFPLLSSFQFPISIPRCEITLRRGERRAFLLLLLRREIPRFLLELLELMSGEGVFEGREEVDVARGSSERKSFI